MLILWLLCSGLHILVVYTLTYHNQVDSEIWESPIPIFILYCEKHRERALLCNERLSTTLQVPYEKITMIKGDDTLHWMYKKNRNFFSLCKEICDKNIEVALVFEEDAEMYPNRVQLFRNAIIWALNNKSLWQWYSFGCISALVIPCAAINSVQSVVGTSVTAHAFLIKQSAAQQFLNKDHRKDRTQFDVWASRNLVQYKCMPGVFFQNVNPDSMADMHICGSYKDWQDAGDIISIAISWSLVFAIFYCVISTPVWIIRSYRTITKSNSEK